MDAGGAGSSKVWEHFHNLTLLAGEDDFRSPSAVYHISWYPGTSSCLVKDLEKINIRLQLQQYAGLRERWDSGAKRAENRKNSRSSQPIKYGPRWRRHSKPDCFRDSEKDLRDERKYKECCGCNAIRMHLSQITPANCICFFRLTKEASKETNFMVFECSAVCLFRPISVIIPAQYLQRGLFSCLSSLWASQSILPVFIHKLQLLSFCSAPSDL